MSVPARLGVQPLRLAVGEETLDRAACNSAAISSNSGSIRYTVVRARKTEVVTKVKVCTGTTAAGATPTLCKIGVYLLTPNGDGTYTATQVAVTANDTTLFAAASTAYTRNLAASFTKQAGELYAVATLVVTAAATPTFAGASLTIPISEVLLDPPIGGSSSGNADLPTTVASLGNSAQTVIYGVLLP